MTVTPPTDNELAQQLTTYFAAHAGAVVLADGKVLFHLAHAQHKISTERGNCLLHLWSAENNLVRRVVGVRLRRDAAYVEVLRLGSTATETLELSDNRDRRVPATRKAGREKFLQALERALARECPEWKVESLRSAVDLERGFGPGFVRGELRKGNASFAIVGVGAQESRATIDDALTVGVLWLDHLRSRTGSALSQGLKLIVPKGAAAVSAARMPWMNAKAARWELYEFDLQHEELRLVEPGSRGNLLTAIGQAPSEEMARQRFATEIAQIVKIAPRCDVRVVSAGEIAFAMNGLDFARAGVVMGEHTFARERAVYFGIGAQGTLLTEETRPRLAALVARLTADRTAGGKRREPLFRMAPEAWLESQLCKQIDALDAMISPTQVTNQVNSVSAGDRGLMDLLARRANGQLVVIELKASEDMHLALQGLDYWIRVRHHLREGEFARRGYFGGAALATDCDPLLYYAAPALNIHPATEIVLKYFSPQIEWSLFALDERWRERIRIVWRKRRR